MPFVEFERAALWSGEAPEPFEPFVEKGLEEPFVLLPSPSRPCMVFCRFRFRGSSLSLVGSAADLGLPFGVGSRSTDRSERLRRPSVWAGGANRPSGGRMGWVALFASEEASLDSWGSLLSMFGWGCAEMFMLEDAVVEVGVDGSAEVDGDKVGGRVMSWSARTKSAEVPLVTDTECLVLNGTQVSVVLGI